jgi:hypothetical protein
VLVVNGISPDRGGLPLALYAANFIGRTMGAYLCHGLAPKADRGVLVVVAPPAFDWVWPALSGATRNGLLVVLGLYVLIRAAGSLAVIRAAGTVLAIIGFQFWKVCVRSRRRSAREAVERVEGPSRALHGPRGRRPVGRWRRETDGH